MLKPGQQAGTVAASLVSPSRIFYMSVEFALLYSEASGGVINACSGETDKLDLRM